MLDPTIQNPDDAILDGGAAVDFGLSAVCILCTYSTMYVCSLYVFSISVSSFSKVFTRTVAHVLVTIG